MQDFILEAETPIKITLRRSARARRLSLRVSRLDGRVTLTMPTRVATHVAEAFIREKSDWIRAQVNAHVPQEGLRFGARIPFLGQDLVLTPGQGRAAYQDGNALIVPGDARQIAPRVKAFLKVQAQMRLREASDRHAEGLGVTYGKLTLRDPRSRWGSCTSEGNLMYSWRLVMAPEAVLDYVAAHEVAHRLEMNHSDRFWAQVARACPEYTVHRQWLRTQGHKLHAWQFEVD